MVLKSVNTSSVVDTGSSKSSSKSKFSFFSSGSSSKSSKPINNALSVQDLSVSSSQGGAHTSSPNLASASHYSQQPSEKSSALLDSNGKDSSHRYASQVKSSDSATRQLHHPSPPITKSQSVSTLVSDSVSASGHQANQDSELSTAKFSTTGHSTHPHLLGKEHPQHQSKSGQVKSVNMPLSAEETQLHCKWHSHFYFPLLSLLCFLYFFMLIAVDVALSLPLSSSACLCLCVFLCQTILPGIERYF